MKNPRLARAIYGGSALSALTLLFFSLSLGGCGFSSATPTPDVAYIEALVQTSIASMPTFAPSPTPPPAEVPPTATATASLPTPTLTLIFQPSPTATPSLTECPLIVTLTDTKAGDLLHVRRCEDNLEYDLGPLAKGVYAAGPNYKFIVYVANNGYLYAARVGEDHLSLLKDLVKERNYTAVNRGVPPRFVISFRGEAPYYKIILYEGRFAQKYEYSVPAWMAE